MDQRLRMYVCIDLKSFYASVECADRGLDPFKTNLVVADPSRGRGTICLAITPAMKALGVRNRCRVYEIPEGISYLTAVPRMTRYMEVSAEICGIYLRYVSPEDMHVYSIDECFIDATPYLARYGQTPRQFAQMLMDAVFEATRISATVGIGTNLFLAKVALDITAKHVPDRIGFLDEEVFKLTVWRHRPITDIWNIGPGIARRLARYGVYDLAGVAAMREETLYREFGVNADFLIDHAHGREPCTIRQIREYTPKATSLSNGQVLFRDYSYNEAQVVLREMVEGSTLDLVERCQVAGGIGLYVGYATPQIGAYLKARTTLAPSPGREVLEPYGKALAAAGGAGGGEGAGVFGGAGEQGELALPSPMLGQLRTPFVGASRTLAEPTNSFEALVARFLALFAQVVDPSRAIRRINVSFTMLADEQCAVHSLFADVERLDRERDLQRTMIGVRDRFGKNALFRGASLRPGANARERNLLVGGHRA